MTNRECINYFKEQILLINNSIHQQDMGTTLRIAKELEAFNLSIQALEKQEPKKPIEEGAFYHTYSCSKCGNSVSDDETYAYNYCPNCGQATDWSKE